jgi:hypothetical protein
MALSFLLNATDNNLANRTFIEQMKADILQRAEEINSSTSPVQSFFSPKPTQPYDAPLAYRLHIMSIWDCISVGRWEVGRSDRCLDYGAGVDMNYFLAFFLSYKPQLGHRKNLSNRESQVHQPRIMCE